MAASDLKYEAMHSKFENFAAEFDLLEILAQCERFAGGLAHDGEAVYEMLATMQDSTGRQCGAFMPPALRKFDPHPYAILCPSQNGDRTAGEKDGIATAGPDMENRKEDRATKRLSAIHPRHAQPGAETPETILEQVRQKKAELLCHLQALKTCVADSQEAGSSWTHLQDTYAQQARSSAADVCNQIQKLLAMRTWTTKVAMLLHRVCTVLGTKGFSCATVETLTLACDGLAEDVFWEQLFHWPLDEVALLSHRFQDPPGGRPSSHKQGHRTKSRGHQSEVSKATAGKMLVLLAFSED